MRDVLPAQSGPFNTNSLFGVSFYGNSLSSNGNLQQDDTQRMPTNTGFSKSEVQEWPSKQVFPIQCPVNASLPICELRFLSENYCIAACIQNTHQHNEFVCLGTVEDAVGSDSFPEVFVNVVICTAVNKKTSHRRVGFNIHSAPVGRHNNSFHLHSFQSTHSKTTATKCYFNTHNAETLTCPSGLPVQGWGLYGRSSERKGCWG